jgi:hypothetical protein
MKCGSLPDSNCTSCSGICSIGTKVCGDPIAANCSVGNPDILAYYCGTTYCGKDSCGSSPGCDAQNGSCTLSNGVCHPVPASYACGGATCDDNERWTASIVCTGFTPEHCADSCQPDASCGSVKATATPIPTATTVPAQCAPRTGCSANYPGFSYSYTPVNPPTCSFAPPYPNNGGQAIPPPPITVSTFGDYRCNTGLCGGTCPNTPETGCSASYPGYRWTFVPRNLRLFETCRDTRQIWG